MNSFKLPDFPLTYETLQKNYEFYAQDIIYGEITWNEVIDRLSSDYDLVLLQDLTAYSFIDVPKSLQEFYHDKNTSYWAVINNEKSISLYKRDPFCDLPQFQRKDYLIIAINPVLDKWYSNNNELFTKVKYYKGISEKASKKDKIMFSVVLRLLNEFKAMDQTKDASNSLMKDE